MIVPPHSLLTLEGIEEGKQKITLVKIYFHKFLTVSYITLAVLFIGALDLYLEWYASAVALQPLLIY